MFSKVIVLLLIASTKFVFAPATSVIYKFNYLETVIITIAGGILGILFYAVLTNILVILYRRFLVNTAFMRNFNDFFNRIFYGRNRKPRVFSRRNRMIVRVKKTYGLIGLAAITPVLLSIPIGTFITLRYFPQFRRTFLFLVVSVIFWANFLTFLAIYFRIFIEYVKS